jgi:hypothetical protein
VTGNQLMAIGLLIGFGVYGYQATGFERSLSVDVVGPHLFPILIAGLGSALAVLLIVQDYMKKTIGGSVSETDSYQFDNELIKLVPWLLMLAYVLMLYLFGFYVASFAFLISLGWWFGIRSIVRLLVYSTGVVAVSALLFRTALDMLLPEAALAWTFGF